MDSAQTGRKKGHREQMTYDWVSNDIQMQTGQGRKKRGLVTREIEKRKAPLFQRITLKRGCSIAKLSGAT